MGIHFNRAVRFESRKEKGIHKFFQGHSMLQAQGNRNGKIIHETSEGSSFLVHVQKDFSQCAVFIFPGP